MSFCCVSDVKAAERTGHFDIRVGNSPQIRENENCTWYEGPVPTGSSATIDCNTKLSGRYVSLQRTGGTEPDLINICEVVVMGYKKILASL